MANRISIEIETRDKNSRQVMSAVRGNIKDTSDAAKEGNESLGNLNSRLGALAGLSASAGVATYSLVGIMTTSTNSVNKLEAALIGLNSVATAFGQNADRAKNAAQELASDGLMTVADAATGLKNLLAAGFSLDDATTLMKRFKDSAAFGRQSALSFGQAVSSATEGIKNGNSILVDNAGVTKNLSMMLTEAGYSAQDLMKASSDAGVRQAIFNGILKETNAQAGDAAKLAESAAGKQAVWAAQVEILHQRIGSALQPALLALLSTVTPIITSIAGWVEKNPQLAAGILIVVTSLTALLTVVGLVTTAIGLLAPAFALFQTAAVASIGGVSTAFVAMKALVLSPIFMPAIAVAAAIAAIFSVKAAYDQMASAIENKERTIQASLNQTNAMIKRNAEVQASGVYSPEMKARTQAATTSAMNMDKALLGRSIGTNYAPGGSTLVGEHGPEVVNLPAGSRVSPAWKSRNETASGGSGETTIQINGNVILQTAAAVDAFFKQQDQAQRFARMGMGAAA